MYQIEMMTLMLMFADNGLLLLGVGVVPQLMENWDDDCDRDRG